MPFHIASSAFEHDGAIPPKYSCDGQNISPTTMALPEGDAYAGTAGMNGFAKSGYGGPCPPPSDPAHRYRFHLYALDIASLGHPGMEKEDALKAMERHVLEEAELVGTYRRQRTHARR